MNRLLYQLSYAAIYGQEDFGTAEISFIIILKCSPFVKQKNNIFQKTSKKTKIGADRPGKKAVSPCFFVSLQIFFFRKNPGGKITPISTVPVLLKNHREMSVK